MHAITLFLPRHRRILYIASLRRCRSYCWVGASPMFGGGPQGVPARHPPTRPHVNKSKKTVYIYIYIWMAWYRSFIGLARRGSAKYMAVRTHEVRKTKKNSCAKHTAVRRKTHEVRTKNSCAKHTAVRRKTKNTSRARFPFIC
jgi:hypothetical protein